MINSCGEVTGKDDSLHDNDLDDDGDDDDDDDDGDDVDDGDDADDDADGLRCFQQRLLRTSNGFYGCSTPPASPPCESDTDLLHYLKCSKHRQNYGEDGREGSAGVFGLSAVFPNYLQHRHMKQETARLITSFMNAET